MEKVARRKNDPDSVIRVRSNNKDWKVELEMREATPVGVEGPDIPNLVVYVDAEDGSEPISHSRALTDTELSDPDFDPEVLVAQLTEQLITKKVTIENNKSKLNSLFDNVKKDRPVDLNKEII